MVDRTSEIWGSDEHGELRSGYRPSGQPGVCIFFPPHVPGLSDLNDNSSGSRAATLRRRGSIASCS